ncbi:MAG: DMT family transporter [Anaerolineales bacterium]
MNYIIGVALGILGGILTQFGQLLEKQAVNQVRIDNAENGFMRRLFRNRIWVLGVIFGLGGGTAAYMMAQSMIGPALTPGLMAAGLIVLAIGSVRINHETLNTSEIIGIGLMIIGVSFLGLSELGINQPQVRATLTDHNALIRVAIFTVSLFLISIAIRSVAHRVHGRKGMFIALTNGFLACLSDFWINPFLALILIVLSGNGSFTQSIIFVIAALILMTTATVITWQNQLAFKVAQASNVVPVAQVPIQISPILVYFYIFALKPPSQISVIYILAGTVLTIVSGFLLGRRKEEAI